jgi:hypothetical protein
MSLTFIAAKQEYQYLFVNNAQIVEVFDGNLLYV